MNPIPANEFHNTFYDPGNARDHSNNDFHPLDLGPDRVHREFRWFARNYLLP